MSVTHQGASTARPCKRRAARQIMQHAARFRFSNEAAQDGLITDFSVEGLFLQISASARAVHMKPRQRTRLMIALQLKNHVLKFLGQVTRHTPRGLGVKFVNCDPKKLAWASKLLQDVHTKPLPKAHQVGLSQHEAHHSANAAMQPQNGQESTVSCAKQAPSGYPGAQKLRRLLADSFVQKLAGTTEAALKHTKARIAEEAQNAGAIFGAAADWLHDKNTLDARGAALLDHFLTAVSKAFKGYLRGFTPKPILHVRAATQYSQLSLLSDQELKNSVILTSRAKTEERNCEGQLFELTLRLRGLLNINEQTELPIRPTHLAELFIESTQAYNLTDKGQEVMVQFFNHNCLKALPEAYEKLNVILIEHGSHKDITTDTAWQNRMRNSIHSKYEAASRQQTNNDRGRLI